MDEYIKRSDMRAVLERASINPRFADEPPTAPVALVVHGRWEKSDKFHGYVCCSICNNAYVSPDWLIGGKWGYCPSCGAKMDKEGHDELDTP